MNRLVLSLIVLALNGLLSSLAQARPEAVTAQDAARQPMFLAQNLPGSSDNPYNSPIRRANPNSMQGTRPSAPTVRSPNFVPVPRPPTLENGGIGNGYPRSSSVPGSVKPSIQKKSRPRDSNDSNR
jgi:hypothetical protein